MPRRKKHDEELEPKLLTPEEFEEYEEDMRDQITRISELYRRARVNCDNERTHALWGLFKSLKAHEREFLQEQAALRAYEEDLDRY